VIQNTSKNLSEFVSGWAMASSASFWPCHCWTVACRGGGGGAKGAPAPAFKE